MPVGCGVRRGHLWSVHSQGDGPGRRASAPEWIRLVSRGRSAASYLHSNVHIIVFFVSVF